MASTESKIVPCIWFDDQAEDAAALYVRLLPGSRVLATARYPEGVENPSGKPPGSVITAEFELAGQRFTALNGGPMFKPSPSISFFINVDTAKEADRVFGLLADGGTALMPLDSYPWSERYGWIQDRFGVSWQVMASRRPVGVATIIPCLMFAGPQHGKAEQAMRQYVDTFPGSRIESIDRYAPGEGPEGTVKHGRFVVTGQQMVAMDSHVSHDITFSEGLSLQLMCRDQAEIDRYWDALAEGGEHSYCGWLKDRFGVSWQVVPTELATWISGEDSAARDRAFEAMMQMRKIDIATIKRAYEGS